MSKEVELLAGAPFDGESQKAIKACNDYLRMGGLRSLPKLHKKYTKTHKNTPPTSSLDTLKKWSSDFDWQARAAEYDAELEDRKNERRSAVMEKALALDYERVAKLKKLASFLEGQIYEKDDDGNYPRVWVPDVKQIGGGEHAERVDIVRFNASLVSEYRSTLDDLAKETGGRKQKSEVTGKDGGPIQVDDIGLSDDERAERVVTLLDRARTRRDRQDTGK